MGGAALLLAEQRRPGTFAALWLFEPVVFPTGGPTGAPRANPLAEGARRRRATFPSYEAALANFASKPPMSVLDPAALEQYVRHGFAEQPDGSVELRCRPDDEAAVYDMGLRHDAFAHLARGGLPGARGAREPHRAGTGAHRRRCWPRPCRTAVSRPTIS